MFCNRKNLFVKYSSGIYIIFVLKFRCLIQKLKKNLQYILISTHILSFINNLIYFQELDLKSLYLKIFRKYFFGITINFYLDIEIHFDHILRMLGNCKRKLNTMEYNPMLDKILLSQGRLQKNIISLEFSIGWLYPIPHKIINFYTKK